MHNLAGMRFGRLVAIETNKSSKSHRRLWLCKCDCGNMVEVASDSLVCGNTKSCGCLQKEIRVTANTKHGYCGTRLYRIWKGMISRCYQKSSTDYKWYGEKGVEVCEEWKKFINFKDWAVEHGYSDSLTIDRINPYGNYNPKNCRWCKTAEQNKNRRRKQINVK